MRRTGPPSEIRRLVEPVARVLDGVWQRMHWWVATMAVLYLLSGITVIKPDEVAVILRWGRLVGATPALQEHGPGLLFAFPKPIDQVVRVQTKHVWEVPVNTLNAEIAPMSDVVSGGEEDEEGSPMSSVGSSTLDPITQGYAITGDENVVHVKMMARYHVRDAAEWAFYGPKAEDILRVEVTAAVVRSLGEMGVDRVLSDGRKDLIATATRRAQAGLDKARSGLELSSLELTRLSPPAALASDFDAVQSAFIEAQTKLNDAQAFAQRAIPEAQAAADAAVQTAQGTADADFSTAKGEAEAFLALDKEYRANAAVVRERLYRNAVDKAIGDARVVRWVPPPVGGNYHGFRITLEPPGSQVMVGGETE